MLLASTLLDRRSSRGDEQGSSSRKSQVHRLHCIGVCQSSCYLNLSHENSTVVCAETRLAKAFPLRQCLPGTRIDLVTKIEKSDDSPRKIQLTVKIELAGRETASVSPVRNSLIKRKMYDMERNMLNSFRAPFGELCATGPPDLAGG